MDGTKEDWDNVIQGQERTEETFEASLQAFMRRFMTHETKSNLIDYIQTCRKPKQMPVLAFVRRLQALNRFGGELPDDASTPNFTEAQMKKIVLNAMPKPWQ